MEKEKIKINFLGFEIECENPSKTAIVIIAMVLMFLTAIIIV